MGIPVNEIIKIVNEHSQLVLEIEGEATTEGTRAEQYTDTEKDHQQWKLIPADSGNNGFYRIVNVHSGMSLEVVGYSTDPGAEIVQRPYSDGPPHRQWKLIPVTGNENLYLIENRNSGLVIDDVGGQTEAPAPVKQYAAWNAPDGRQHWQLIPVAVPRKVALVNGGFEQPTVTASIGYEYFPDASQTQEPNRVPGWLTTATDHKIELWKSGRFEGVVSAEGGQHAELNATMLSTLYQDLETTPGTTLSWGLWHRGTRGMDTMAVDIGPPEAPVEQKQITNGKEWKRYDGTYRVPEGQTMTRFALRSISSTGSDPGTTNRGNLVDDVFFGTK
jgi:Ricin-type beta-trefoil lectin domain-like